MNLHSGYRIFWIFWLAGLLAIYVAGLDIFWARVHLASFFPVETLGFKRKGPGDTLSEFMQRIADKAAPNAKWWQGWNAPVVGILCLIAYEVFWVFGYFDGPLGRWPAGAIAALTVFWWNLYHWIRRHKYDYRVP